MRQLVMIVGLTERGNSIIDGGRVGQVCYLEQGYVCLRSTNNGFNPKRHSGRYRYIPYLPEDDPYLKQLESL